MKKIRGRLRRAAAKGRERDLIGRVVRALVWGRASERRRENTERLRAFLSGSIGVVSNWATGGLGRPRGAAPTGMETG